MGRQLWIADALRNAGLRVVEEPGWRERGSNDFDPHGVVCHHTASNRNAGPAPSLKTVIAGRPDLKGPLCHVLIGRDGTCHVIAAGKANHAGSGSWKGLSGNHAVLGIEAENNGIGEPWSPHMIDVFERCAASLAHGCLCSADFVCGHKEWTPRKIDPAGIDMAGFRKAVAGLLHTAPAPPAPIKEDDMAVIIRSHNGTRYEVTDWVTKHGIPSNTVEAELQRLGLQVVDVSDALADSIPLAK